MAATQEDFDLEEEDFLQAALDIAQTFDNNNGSATKRRSFELGLSQAITVTEAHVCDSHHAGQAKHTGTGTYGEIHGNPRSTERCSKIAFDRKDPLGLGRVLLGNSDAAISSESVISVEDGACADALDCCSSVVSDSVCSSTLPGTASQESEEMLSLEIGVVSSKTYLTVIDTKSDPRKSSPVHNSLVQRLDVTAVQTKPVQQTNFQCTDVVQNIINDHSRAPPVAMGTSPLLSKRFSFKPTRSSPKISPTDDVPTVVASASRDKSSTYGKTLQLGAEHHTIVSRPASDSPSSFLGSSAIGSSRLKIPGAGQPSPNPRVSDMAHNVVLPSAKSGSLSVGASVACSTTTMDESPCAPHAVTHGDLGEVRLGASRMSPSTLFQIDSQGSPDISLDLSLDSEPQWIPGRNTPRKTVAVPAATSPFLIGSEPKKEFRSTEKVFSAKDHEDRTPSVNSITSIGDGSMAVQYVDGRNTLLAPKSLTEQKLVQVASSEDGEPCVMDHRLKDSGRFMSENLCVFLASSETNHLAFQLKDLARPHSEKPASCSDTPKDKLTKLPVMPVSRATHQAKAPSGNHSEKGEDADCFKTPSGVAPRGGAAPTPMTTPQQWAAESSPASTSCSSISTKRKRKFPGPAGVLPKLKGRRSLEDASLLKPASPRPAPSRPPPEPLSDLPCSQNWEEKFTESPWQQMKQELEPQAVKILDAFNIAAIQRMASRRQLPCGKVPVMCLLIDSISIQNADASALLRDPSGDIQGTIHRQVMREHTLQMAAGTVLVLRQVGVFSPTNRTHYLNITPNNIVRIYARADSQGCCLMKVGSFDADDFKIPEPPTAPMVVSCTLNQSAGPRLESPIGAGNRIFSCEGSGRQGSPAGRLRLSTPYQQQQQQQQQQINVNIPGRFPRQSLHGPRHGSPSQQQGSGWSSGSQTHGSMQGLRTRASPGQPSLAARMGVPSGLNPGSALRSSTAPGQGAPPALRGQDSHRQICQQSVSTTTSLGQSPHACASSPTPGRRAFRFQKAASPCLASPAPAAVHVNPVASTPSGERGADIIADDLWQDDQLDALLTDLDF